MGPSPGQDPPDEKHKCVNSHKTPEANHVPLLRSDFFVFCACVLLVPVVLWVPEQQTLGCMFELCVLFLSVKHIVTISICKISTLPIMNRL